MKLEKFKEFIDLDKRIKSFEQGYRQNIALLGDDSDGTADFISHYLSRTKIENILFLRVTTSYVDDRAFFQCLVTSLLSGYIHRDDILDRLIASAEYTLPATTDFIKMVLKRERYSFMDFLDVINRFVQETERRCVLIIEEFLELNRLFSSYHQDFSRFIVLQRSCMVLITSSSLKEAERKLSSDLNLLFGNFEKIYVNQSGFLEDYIYFKDMIAPLQPSWFLLSYFVNIIGKHRAYYDVMTDAIKNVYNTAEEESGIIEVIEKTLLSRDTYFSQKFLRKIDALKNLFRDYVPALKMLFALSEGYLRKKELLSLSFCNAKESVVKLQKLVDYGYIDNLGSIYKIKDSLFSFWISHVFKFHSMPPFIDHLSKRTWWRNMMMEELALFKESLLQDERKIILELIACFQNDTLVIGRERYVLPFVKKAEIIASPSKDLFFLIGEGEEIIFAGIKLRGVQDNDMFEFIEQGKNIQGKGVRKIFIALDQCPSSTKLIAKNNRVIMWDADHVNQLLNIYNKVMLPLFQRDGEHQQEGGLKFERHRNNSVMVCDKR